MHPMLNIAIRAARLAGVIISRAQNRLYDLRVSQKGLRDYVTQIDVEAEKAIIETLSQAYPSHAILAEESGKAGKSDYTWVIDPLDGTTNYIHGFPYYAISIAYVEKGKTLHALIIDVARQDEFTASLGRGAYLNNRRIRVSKAKELSGTLLSNSSHDTDKGRVRHDNMSTFRSLYSNGLTIRRTGSAALDMANVAAGRLDGFWGSGLGMWDIAAGGLLVREAGGLVSDYFGNPDYLSGDNIICSTNKCFKPMLQSIKPYTSIVEV